jgi:hypothetical protein
VLFRPASLALVSFIVSAALLAACGGDDGGGSERTGTPAPTLAPGQTSQVDLATDDALLKMFGAGAGDLASDIPALAAGDFNGDGVDDLVIGARFADPDGLPDSGEAYIVFGAAGTGGEVDLAGEADVVVRGADGGDNLGFSAAAADLNGDGIDDLALGAPFAGDVQGPGSRPGTVYIIFGRDSLGGRLDLADGDADVTIAGETASAFFGDSLATGDVTGDGAADLVIGSTFARRADGTQSGAAYVFSGTTDWPGQILTEDGGYTAVIFGEDDLDELGDTVAVGDVNGDGTDDVIVTSEAADGPENDRTVAGEVSIILGGDRLTGVLIIGQAEIAARLYGAEQNDTLGFDLAAGDIDGDGFDDVALTARLASGPDNSLSSAGEAYVLYGSSSLPGEVDLADNFGNLVGYYAPDEADLMGRTVILPSGETSGQLLLGAAFGDGPSRNRGGSGEVYAVEPRRLDAGLTAVDAVAHLVIYGAAGSDALGAGFVPVDINGDGARELAIVAAGASPDANRPGFGIVYVITGP